MPKQFYGSRIWNEKTQWVQLLPLLSPQVRSPLWASISPLCPMQGLDLMVCEVPSISTSRILRMAMEGGKSMSHLSSWLNQKGDENGETLLLELPSSPSGQKAGLGGRHGNPPATWQLGH